MSYDIHLTIPEESPQGKLITILLSTQKISPSQAVELIIDQAVQVESPAELVARLRAQKAAKGDHPQPPLHFDDPEQVIGMFSDSPEVAKDILDIVEMRSARYASRP